MNPKRKGKEERESIFLAQEESTYEGKGRWYADADGIKLDKKERERREENISLKGKSQQVSRGRKEKGNKTVWPPPPPPIVQSAKNAKQILKSMGKRRGRGKNARN